MRFSLSTRIEWIWIFCIWLLLKSSFCLSPVFTFFFPFPEAAWPRRRLWRAMPVASSWLLTLGIVFWTVHEGGSQTWASSAFYRGWTRDLEGLCDFETPAWDLGSVEECYDLFSCWRETLLFKCPLEGGAACLPCQQSMSSYVTHLILPGSLRGS